jgi:beta-exotoxin I transport system permease protein
MNARNLELIFGPVRTIIRAAIIWTACIAAIVFVTVAVWPAFKGNTSIDAAMSNLPAGVVQAFGLEGFGTPAGFLRGNLYDFFIPLLIAGAGVGFANSLTSSDEDGGRLEVVLAQPVKRQAIFLGRAVAVFAWIAVITVVTAVVQFASDALFDLQIGTDRLLATLILCGLLAFFTAGLSLAVAGLAAKPSMVLGAGLFVAVGGCIIAALFPLSSAVAELAHLSPWDWAFSGDPLLNGAEMWRYFALGIPAIAMVVFGVWAFGRRDVAAA